MYLSVVDSESTWNVRTPAMGFFRAFSIRATSVNLLGFRKILAECGLEFRIAANARPIAAALAFDLCEIPLQLQLLLTGHDCSFPVGLTTLLFSDKSKTNTIPKVR